MFKVGDVITDNDIEITDEIIRLFAKCSGDYNPIHVDEEFAKKSRFGRRIAHGMLSGALISRALATKLGINGIYLSQNLKFLKPVFIGDKLTIELKVLSLREEKGLASIGTNVINQSGEVVVKGDAMIKW